MARYKFLDHPAQGLFLTLNYLIDHIIANLPLTSGCFYLYGLELCVG
jgi:hypothetical protein